MSCDVDDFREWHEARIRELYAGTMAYFQLQRDREDFMARAGWSCCKEET